jgi:hypothetical protein
MEEDPCEFRGTYFDCRQDRSAVIEFLNKKIGFSLWYDTFTPKNKKWLRLVRGIPLELHKDNICCGVLGLYPAYLAGLIPYFESINIYIACSEGEKRDLDVM